MTETTPVSFVDLMALEALGKVADKYMSKRPSFNSTSMLDLSLSSSFCIRRNSPFILIHGSLEMLPR